MIATLPTPGRDPVLDYEDAIVNKLYQPRRDPAADASARERRRARIVELQKRREEAAREEPNIVRRVEAEQRDLHTAEVRYKDVLMTSTSQAVKAKAEIAVLTERVSQLEGSLAAKRQEIAQIDMEVNAIAAEEKQAAENEAIGKLLAESGARAAAIIDESVRGLQELRGITTGLLYNPPAGCSAANAKRLAELADMIVTSYRIRLYKRLIGYDLPDRTVFLQYLRKAQWP